MPLFKIIYLALLNATIIRWLLIAQDTASTLVALSIGVLTVIYMFYKMKNERRAYKKSKNKSDE